MKNEHPALAAAKKAAAERSKEAPAPEKLPNIDLDAEECLVQLFIEMLSSGLKMGLGAMPDGMAFWIRLSMPGTSASPYAGLVSFLVAEDPTIALRKAVAALETAPKPPFWKPDMYARTQPQTS
jgi:hypothetical protein